WDALYREGVALTELKKPAEAVRRFRSLLQIHVADDSPSIERQAKKKGQLPGRPAQARQRGQQAPEGFPLQERYQNVYQVRTAAGLESRRNYGNQQTFWAPADFGQARMAALAWLYALAQNDNKQSELVKEFQA